VAEITLEQVTKIYPDGTRAVCAVDLEIADGALVVLVGPSGCGKTTLLRMVAGLERITEGAIRIGGRIVNHVSAKERDIAMVFQNYALYPHMSVYDNMAFGLRLRRERKAVIDERVTGSARMLGLFDQLRKKPRHLSGGQRQRVAMGRAIVRQPQAFLMDEPLSNLDAKLRVQMRAEIGRMQKDLGVTTIYVTHDQTEAMTLGDLVAVMRQGVLQQVAEPQTLYRRPANLFVAGFIGSPAMNLVEASVTEENGSVYAGFAGNRLRLAEEALARCPALRRFAGSPVVLGIRPEHMEDASLVRDAPVDQRFQATIDLREEMGAEVYAYFTVQAPPVLTEDIRELAADTDAAAVAELEHEAERRVSRFVARLDPNTQVREREQTQVYVDTRHLHFFDPATGEAIYDDEAPAGKEAQQ
jgi:multiple sugar transport system ATP-binding protein